MKKGAVAVDLGATSGRFAAGTLRDGAIAYEIIEQIPHAPRERNGRLEWDLDTLLGLCRRAVAYAEAHFDEATVGIDSWGVDHGFFDASGSPLGAPVCYRDPSHAAAFERLQPVRGQLYALTGIQHQPFNTICQLVARREENPALTQARWAILPDFLGELLGDCPHHESTQASTTQLQGLDGAWSEGAFELAGWPVPNLEPALPGTLGAEVARGVRIARVGSHDTASAVAGFGRLADDTIFLNVGTWSLVGTVLENPLATPEAEAANFTNERCVDGRIRFLRNVPGFYVINRLHDELEIRESVPEWLLRARKETDARIDVFAEAFFNPTSMLEACRTHLSGHAPETPEGWAEVALGSLVAAVAAQPPELARLTGRTFRAIRVGGGGSQSEAFCSALAQATGLEVVAGPAEATVLGNLALQFRASGELQNPSAMESALAASVQVRRY